MLIDKKSADAEDSFRRKRNDESIEHADSQQHFHGCEEGYQTKRPERRGHGRTQPGCQRPHFNASTGAVASRTSSQIWDTNLEKAGDFIESELRGRGRSTVTILLRRPGRGDMTTIRSESCTASVILCVTRRIVCCNCRWISRTLSPRVNRVCSSSAAKGSSINMIFG